MIYNTVIQIRSRCSSVCIPIRIRRYTSTGVSVGSVCDRGWRLIALECVVSYLCVCVLGGGCQRRDRYGEMCMEGVRETGRGLVKILYS
jgi:hypothetical protein